MTEPDDVLHHIFDTWSEAMQAWMLLPDDTVAPPRQSHGCWLFDRQG